MAKPLRGQCLCGAIKFTVDFPPPVPEGEQETINTVEEDGVRKYRGSHCHCTTCRRSSGALFQSFFFPARRLFHFDASNTASPKAYVSSDLAQREFCPVCGTAMFYISRAHPEVQETAIACLEREDAARGVAITKHGWLGDAVRGDGMDMTQLKDGLPKYQGESPFPLPESDWHGYGAQ